MEDYSIIIRCGCNRKGKAWPIKNPKANIVIFEGMEEYAERYDYFATSLNKEGYSVYCIDTYGQGANVNDDLSNLGLWNKGNFLKQVDIYDQLISKLKEETKLPCYIFAHSMGAYMAVEYIERYHQVDKVIISGVRGKIRGISFADKLAKMIVNNKNKQEKATTLNKLMFGGFNKKIKNHETSFDWLSYNKENVKKYIADPLCGFGPRNLFCKEFINSVKNIYKSKNLAKVDKNTNIFLLSGLEDPVAHYGKGPNEIKKLLSKKGVNKVTTKVYPNMRHECLNEDDRDNVIKDIISFYN